jgi:capsular polysaccharide biosynthesis protein
LLDALAKLQTATTNEQRKTTTATQQVTDKVFVARRANSLN